jgi:copper chaperone CopZ
MPGTCRVCGMPAVGGVTCDSCANRMRKALQSIKIMAEGGMKVHTEDTDPLERSVYATIRGLAEEGLRQG